MNQDALMIFDPATGTSHPYPSHAKQWRRHCGSVAWLFNPWTGGRRDARDVGSDPFGYLIKVHDELLTPASSAQETEVDDDHVCGVCEGTQRGVCNCKTPAARPACTCEIDRDMCLIHS